MVPGESRDTAHAARAEILAYYQSHDTPLFPSDVAEALCLDVVLVKQITDQLVADGVIG